MATSPSAAGASGFSYANVFSPAEENDLRQLLADKGVRLLPYPFASAVSVVSDVDASRRARYDGYVGMLVGELGLDFGDLTWLRWQYFTKQNKSNGFGFFSRYLTIGRTEHPKIFENTRTFNEGIAEFHKGNIDHFHSFLQRGPRVVLVDKFDVRSDGRVEIEFDEFQQTGPWACDDIHVFGVCIVGKPGKPIEVRGVTVRDRGGVVTDRYRETRYDAPPNGRVHRMFTLFEQPEEELPAPQLDTIESVIIEFHDPEHAVNVERVMLTSCYGEILLDRLRFLRDRYNVEIGLITQHAGVHFRNPATERKQDMMLKEHISTLIRPVEAYNGTLVDDDGNSVFSTDADQPHSFCRVFPDLSDDLEVRFVNAQTVTKTFGWNPLEVVTPSPTRAAGGIYCVRRTSPNIKIPLPGRKFDGKSRHSTFAQRMSRVLEDTAREPGLFWPIYTHLGSFDSDPGNVDTKYNVQRYVPSPYFDPDRMRALQDRVFNISRSVPARSRLWFARATVLYDYALMLRGIAYHLERPDANTVHIRSWVDPALGKTLPRSQGQLYGLTFYVNDPGRADVRLDGKRVETLVRNPRDETGRLSVTIAEAAIRYVVFDRLDPVANGSGQIQPVGGEWRWVEPAQEPPFGRLTIVSGEARDTITGTGGGPGIAILKLPLHGLTPTGAQLITFAVMPAAGTVFGLVFETDTGGVFYFGDKLVAARWVQNATAHYFIIPRYRPAGEWRTVTAPFHDLTWAVGAAPGGPMPNHPLASMTILCAGKVGSGISLGRVAFLRPRATAVPWAPADEYCVGGYLSAFTGGETVHLMSQDFAFGAPRTVAVDQRGHFCFDRVPCGIYKVWSLSRCGEIHDRRGAWVEVGTNVMNLVLG